MSPFLRSPRALTAVLALAALLAAAFLLGPALLIPRRIPLNYNEGWNAYFALRAAGLDPAPLYPPPGSLVFNNYPPLSFLVVGALGRFVTHDMIVAGRIAALAGLLASAAFLALAARRLGAPRAAATAAAILLLLFATTFCREYVAMDDPQWLGHALMLAGLAVLLRRWPRVAPAETVAACLLLLAGGFVKHSLVALPLSVTLWLLLVRRPAGLLFLATAAAGVALGIAATLLTCGPHAWADILHHPRLFAASGMLKGAGRLEPLLPMAALAAWRLAPQRRDPAVLLAALFAAIALVTGILQRAGAGVAINAQFETLIALCLAAALALGRPAARLPPAALLALICLPVLVVLPRRAAHAWDDIAHGAARAAAFRPVIARLAATPGPPTPPNLAACETLALCYWAGQPFTLDLFNLSQSLLRGGPATALDALAPRLAAFQVVQPSTIPPVVAPHLPRTLRPVLRAPGGTVLLAR